MLCLLNVATAMVTSPRCDLAHSSVWRRASVASAPQFTQLPLCASGRTRLDFGRLHLLDDVVGRPDGQRADGQRRVLGRARGEHAAVGDEEVLDFMRRS